MHLLVTAANGVRIWGQGMWQGSGLCENKGADQLRSNCEADLTAKLISAFVLLHG